MAIVFYLDGATKSVTTIQPDTINRALVEVFFPEGMPLSFLLSQLQSLNQNISSAQNSVAAALIVVKVTYGS